MSSGSLNSVKIRQAAPADIVEMIRLERAAETAAHWSESQYQALMQIEDGKTSRVALVAFRDSPAAALRNPSVLGFLVAHHVSGEWELENIVVAPEARGVGVGSLLVRDLIDRAKQNNSEAVFLEVRQSNTAARALYEKLGFESLGYRKSYYISPLEDAILYRKIL